MEKNLVKNVEMYGEKKMVWLEYGWKLNVKYSHEDDTLEVEDICGNNTFYGYSYDTGNDKGHITATFIGFGNATLTFGNCGNRGSIVLTLNNHTLGSAGEMENQTITFSYAEGDILMLKQTEDVAIIKLYAFDMRCSGKL